MLWLLALSSFLTATPSSVTNAWLWAFMASDTWAPSGAEMTLGAEMVRIPASLQAVNEEWDKLRAMTVWIEK